MSRFDYDEYEKLESSGKLRSGSSKTAYKGYFKLEDDQDSAIVRFPYTSIKEFDIISYHRVKSGNKKVKVECLRTPLDDVSKCPLCEAEEKLSTKFFVKVIEYSKDEEGKVTATGKIWETRTGFRKTMKSLIDEYGDLRDFIFKVIRHGAKGDTNTTYDIIPASPKIYKDELYPYDESIFEGYNVIGPGGAIRSKTYEQMVTFLETGEFPAPGGKKKETKQEGSRNLDQIEVDDEEVEEMLGEKLDDKVEVEVRCDEDGVVEEDYVKSEKVPVEEPKPTPVRMVRPTVTTPAETKSSEGTFTRPKRILSL